MLAIRAMKGITCNTSGVVVPFMTAGQCIAFMGLRRGIQW